MRKTLRCALIWMLMLALPAQAMAALGMQLCEQVHRSGTQMVTVEHGAHADMAADSGHTGHQQDTTVASSDAPTGASLCTLCAFCVGTAAPGQLFSGDLSLPSIDPAPVWPERLVVGVSDTLERPPRLSLA